MWQCLVILLHCSIRSAPRGLNWIERIIDLVNKLKQSRSHAIEFSHTNVHLSINPILWETAPHYCGDNHTCHKRFAASSWENILSIVQASWVHFRFLARGQIIIRNCQKTSCRIKDLLFYSTIGLRKSEQNRHVMSWYQTNRHHFGVLFCSKTATNEPRFQHKCTAASPPRVDKYIYFYQPS